MLLYAKACSVCQSRLAAKWERYASCDEGCLRFLTKTRHSHQREWVCVMHHPNGKPRYHINYCTLACEHNSLRGKRARARDRHRRYDRKKNAWKHRPY